MKIPYTPRQKKILKDFTDKSIINLYDDNLSLKVNMFYCRIMEKVWRIYHKWILHRGKLTFFTSCMHPNPYRRAYNDMKDFRKNIDKLNFEV